MRQCLLGTRVELTFAKAPFAGTAQGYEVFSDFGDRIQHQVVFDDGFVGLRAVRGSGKRRSVHSRSRGFWGKCASHRGAAGCTQP